MTACNAVASAMGKRGEDRRAYLMECASDRARQQEEAIKTCAAQNRGKKGQEYKDARRACLSGA